MTYPVWLQSLARAWLIIMPKKTKISESQIVQGLLQLLIFIIPFTSIVMTPDQMQAAASLSGLIAVFAWNQRRKQKAEDDV